MSSKATHATGAAQGEQDLRRRNVGSSTDGNGSIPESPVLLDEKKSREVGTNQFTYWSMVLTCA